MMNTDSPKGVCPHVVLAGRRNAGKSSLINAICGQEIAIVSSIPGTTTDPVEKKMELLPFGPIVLIDTAGLDDIGQTGKSRIRRSREMLNRADAIILVTDGTVWGHAEEELIKKVGESELSCIIAVNVKDSVETSQIRDFVESIARFGHPVLLVSPEEGRGIPELKNSLARKLLEDQMEEGKIFADLLADLPGPLMLVVPIDSGAPKGRLILPQAQTIRECLDENRMCVVITEKQLDNCTDFLAEDPALVICDSQIVQLAAQNIPARIPLTTFSILMARLKGNLGSFAEGAKKLAHLNKNSRVLIMEACTHHPQADDIGRVKIPALLKKMAGNNLDIHFHAGRNMPEDNEYWDLIIHCGGCMLTSRQMRERQRWAHDRGISMTNYGMTISHAQGVLARSLEIFPELLDMVK